MQSSDENIYSVIDLGTNTCLLLTAKIKDKTLTKIYEALEIPRLGKDLYKTGNISMESFEKVLDIFSKYISISKEYGSEKIFAFGTSAMRDAKNSKEFTDYIEKHTGIKIRIIGGKDEARYSFDGAVSDLDSSKEYAVLDIGGGSTEICYRESSGINSVSYDIGSVRLYELYFSRETELHDPEEIKAVIKKELGSKKFIAGARELTGVAGTITTLSAIKNGLKDYDEKIVHKDILHISEINEIYRMLTAMTSGERLELGSYMKGRSDVILTGTMILSGVMEYLNQDRIIVSAKGLRYGLLLNISDFNNS